VCVPSRSAALIPRESVVAQCTSTSLVHANGHHAGRKVVNVRFLATIGGVRFQFDTAATIGFLKTGEWSRRPNPRNKSGRNGPRTRVAAALGVTHPVVSRRVAKLKERGVVKHGENGWTVEAAAQCEPWVSPLYAAGREESYLARYG
jgi:hypothetical protein